MWKDEKFTHSHVEIREFNSHFDFMKEVDFTEFSQRMAADNNFEIFKLSVKLKLCTMKVGRFTKISFLS